MSGGPAGAGEQAEVLALVTGDGEVGGVAGGGKHVGGVAADERRFAGVEAVVVVEIEGVRVLGDGAVVDGDLAVVLAAVLQRELEGADGAGGEGGEADLHLDVRVTDRHRGGSQGTGVRAADAFQGTAEVLRVQGACEAFADQDRVVEQ